MFGHTVAEVVQALIEVEKDFLRSGLDRIETQGQGPDTERLIAVAMRKAMLAGDLREVLEALQAKLGS